MTQDFHFAVFGKKAAALIGNVRKALLSSVLAEVRGIASQLPTNDHVSGALTVAFCGQYGAGKSTLIKALSGSKDIEISSDVSTNRVTAYQWNGVLLLDTPGIQAGYEEHDAITYEAIDRADLLVFAVTRQLFGPIIGKHFRELAFDRQKAEEMLLVINKMSLSSGPKEELYANIEEVIDPLKLQDLRTTFVDAKIWLESLECSDSDERKELEQYSGFADFLEALNNFVAEKGLAGRFTTPVYQAKYCAEAAMAQLQVEEPGGREYLEILRRVRGILVASRDRLLRRASGLIIHAKNELAKEANFVAASVYAGESAEELKKISRDAAKKVQSIQEDLKREIEAAIKEELQDLAEEIRRVSEDPFVSAVLDKYGSPAIKSSVTAPDSPHDQPAPREWRKAGILLQQLGEWLRAPAIGAKGADQIILTASGAAGSNLAKWTYTLGKFFGVKFAPWGAVNTAKLIGNIGKVLSVAGGILSVALQIVDEYQKKKREKELQKARGEVLHSFSQIANEMDIAFTKEIQGFVEANYDEAISRLDANQTELTSASKLQSDLAGTLQTFIQEADQLIGEIHGSSSSLLIR